MLSATFGANPHPLSKVYVFDIIICTVDSYMQSYNATVRASKMFFHSIFHQN